MMMMMMMMKKPYTIKQSTQQKGKGRIKRENLSQPQKQNLNKFMKKVMNKLCYRTSISHKKHIKKKKGKET